MTASLIALVVMEEFESDKADGTCRILVSFALFLYRLTAAPEISFPASTISLEVGPLFLTYARGFPPKKSAE